MTAAPTPIAIHAPMGTGLDAGGRVKEVTGTTGLGAAGLGNAGATGREVDAVLERDIGVEAGAVRLPEGAVGAGLWADATGMGEAGRGLVALAPARADSVAEGCNQSTDPDAAAAGVGAAVAVPAIKLPRVPCSNATRVSSKPGTLDTSSKQRRSRSVANCCTLGSLFSLRRLNVSD